MIKIYSKDHWDKTKKLGKSELLKKYFTISLIVTFIFSLFFNVFSLVNSKIYMNFLRYTLVLLIIPVITSFLYSFSYVNFLWKANKMAYDLKIKKLFAFRKLHIISSIVGLLCIFLLYTFSIRFLFTLPTHEFFITVVSNFALSIILGLILSFISFNNLRVELQTKAKIS